MNEGSQQSNGERSDQSLVSDDQSYDETTSFDYTLYCVNCHRKSDKPSEGFKCTCGRWFHFNCKTASSSDRKKSKRRRKLFKKSKSSTNTFLEEPVTLNGQEKGQSEDKSSKPICKDCSTGEHKCFICNTRDESLEKCNEEACQKWYHKSCFRPSDPYLLSNYDDEIKGLAKGKFTCPLHFCFTCYVEYPDNSFAASKNNDLIQCICCPTAYHDDDQCIPAGLEDISSNTILCPEHLNRKEHACQNFPNCFICMKTNDGSSLVRCETCPATCHIECLEYDVNSSLRNSFNSISPVKEESHNSLTQIDSCAPCIRETSRQEHEEAEAITQPAGKLEVTQTNENGSKKVNGKASVRKYTCSNCVRRKPLLLGEVVWSKIGHYRWWPAIILPSEEVPDNIKNMKRDVGHFPVRFLGTNDHYWLHKGRVFSYSRGDAEVSSSMSAPSDTKLSGLDNQFRKALMEAPVEYKKFVDARLSNIRKLASKIKPKFNRIKVNKPVGRLDYNSLIKIFDIQDDDLNSENSFDAPTARSGDSSRKRRFFMSTEKCQCSPPSSGSGDASKKLPCDTESCVNRATLTECTRSNCRSGADDCGNRRFKKRTYPKLKLFHTGDRGWGLKSQEHIPSGTFVIEYVGELIYEDEAGERIRQSLKQNETNFYHLTLHKNIIIDAGPSGNLARFINHSCDPNCFSQKWTVGKEYKIGLFALRDIEPGTELTFDYHLAIHGSCKTPCSCGASVCSGFIGEKAAKPSSRPSAVSEDPSGGRKRKPDASGSNRKKPKKPARAKATSNHPQESQ